METHHPDSPVAAHAPDDVPRKKIGDIGPGLSRLRHGSCLAVERVFCRLLRVSRSVFDAAVVRRSVSLR